MTSQNSPLTKFITGWTRMPHQVEGQEYFFSSSMADVALWLGPYMSIGSKTLLYKDPKGPTMQANHNRPKTTQHNRTTRKSPSQICVSPRGKANQTHKRSQSPNTKKHKQKTDWTRKRRQPRGEGRGGEPGESGPTASTQATKANNKTATTTKLISDIAENKKNNHRQ